MDRAWPLSAASSLAVAVAVVLMGCSPTLVESAEDGADEAGSESSQATDETTAGTSTDEESETGESSTGESSTGETSAGSESTTMECLPGTFGCPCEGGECDPGLECVAGVCDTAEEPFGNCGWDGRVGYYDCGQQGEDPSAEYPIDCGDLALVPDAPCPRGLSGVGCCAVGGDNYWCYEGFVQRQVCGG